MLGEAGGQHRTEHAQCGAQATGGDPHLVHVFRIVAAHGTVVVQLQMRQAVLGDQAEGGQWRVGRIDRHATGLYRCRCRVVEQAVAALRLRQQQGWQGFPLRQLQGKLVEAVDIAGDELQLEFGDGVAAAVRRDPAAVELDLDAGVRGRVELPDGAADVGFKHCGKAAGDLVPLQPGAQFGIVDVGKIEVVEVGRLPFRPQCQAAVRLVLALDHLLPRGAVLAQAQQDAGAAQRHAPGVVVDADQLVLCPRRGRGQDTVPEQGRVAIFSDGQLECNLLSHRVGA